MRKEIPVTQAHRLLQAGPVVLVTAAAKDRSNVTVSPWARPLSLRPPLVGVSLSPATFTHELIMASEEFVINIPGGDLAKEVHFCGTVSGRDADKFQRAGLLIAEAKVVGAPLIDGCLGHLECGLIDAIETGDHTLFIGEVVAAWAEEEAFDGQWLLKEKETKPLHYLGGKTYSLLAEPFEV